MLIGTKQLNLFKYLLFIFIIIIERNMNTLLSVALLTTAVSAYTPEALADQVTDLPGSENINIPFNQFSGYLPVDGAAEGSKKMHYWLVESEGNPATDPVTFWTNGGPGCSGLLGFLTEQGPFQPNADKTLTVNDFAWNKVSNMVFIESPAGVGFSYSDMEEDYTTGDAQTASDNYYLIQEFMKRFPEYASNDLYISSESYGGHYMPTLAKEIVTQNANSTNPALNFKGFAVGNPYADVYSGTPAMIDTYWGHQMIPKPVYDEYAAKCVDSKVPHPKDCLNLEIEINTMVGDINPYALDYPVCLEDSPARSGRAQRTWLFNHMHGIKNSKASKKNLRALAEEPAYQPCEENFASAYLNDLSVQNALHVNHMIWEECSFKVNYDMADSSVSTAPIYNYLIDGGFGLNILVFSGDDDGVCATIGTQNWIWDLGYDPKGKIWQSYEVNDQVAGYFSQWKDTKLGFLTIHGAGHEVPAYKPEIALDMFTRYLAGEFTSA